MGPIVVANHHVTDVMTNQTQTSGFLLRAALRLVFAVAAVFPGTASGIGLVAPAEAEGPSRQTKTVEEAAIGVQAQEQRRHRQADSRFVVAAGHQERFRWAGRASSPLNCLSSKNEPRNRYEGHPPGA